MSDKKMELYFLLSSEHGQMVPIYGFRQTEFLVFSKDGWVWVPMKNFFPGDFTSNTTAKTYEDQVQYINGDRPGMVRANKILAF
jgi:hypothetical protein